MASNNLPNKNQKERIFVSSAIPSAQLNLSSLPSRPKAGNTSNRTELLYTNHFTCQFSKNLPLYQYDVTIEGYNSDSDKWYEIRKRSRCVGIMQSIISGGKFDPQVVVWYDEQKCLYSTSVLSTPQMIMTDDGENRVNIKSLANQWSTDDILNYIDDKAKSYPYDAVRILETLLKKSLQGKVEVINNTCYFLDEQPNILAGEFQERFGFSQALNLSSKRVTLNIQTKLTTFYPEMMLLDFIHIQIGGKRVPNENECRKINRILKDCLVVTKQSDWTTLYGIHRFDSRRPTEITFETGEKLIDYYTNKKKIVLTETDYPCVEVYLLNDYDQYCHLPLEVCRIKGWQVYDKPLSKAQEAQQPRKKIPQPGERYDAIMNMLRKCDYNSPANRLCREVGFHVDHAEMLKLNARILRQPEIHTGSNCRANVRIGRIPLDGHLFTPKPISALAITYFGYDQRQNQYICDQFRKTLISVLQNHNVDVAYEQHYVPPTYEEIDTYFHSMNQEKYELVVCVMNGKNDDELSQLKNNIKDCGTIKHGVMTQCVIFSKIANNRSLKSYCENLIRKINYKNAGINTKVNLNIALKLKKSENDAFMFFGADVIHPTNVTRQHPSISAVVGSGDSLCSTTAVRVCKQYPKTGKCSIETIVGMTEMVEELLDYYGEANEFLPNKIVFYRDGVDDGQFGKIIEHEIPSIRRAFDSFYGDKSNHPLLTFIVVKKRHRTRFFTYDDRTNITSNMSIGSVIDTTIVHPYQNNFYLNSHNAFQGVNHPSLYHVILDEINFTADELHLLTYHLCFTDPRSSASEAIPSVVHQADIAALKARDLFPDDETSSMTNNGGRTRPLVNPTLADLEYEILDVHENLKNRPIFS